MLRITLQPITLFNPNEKLKKITDKEALEAYKKIYECFKLFNEDPYECFFEEFSSESADLYFMPADYSNFMEYYQINNHQELFDSKCCLDTSYNIYYLDQNMKNKLIEYYYSLISEYREEKSSFNKPFESLSKEEKERYLTINSYITDYKETIQNIQDFYNRKTLLFWITDRFNYHFDGF